MWWRIALITFAYILLSAHFLRYGQTSLAITCAALPLLLTLRINIISRLIQVGLVFATVSVWGVSTFQYIDFRMSVEQPWYLLAVIMGSVILFSLFASYSINGLLKQTKRKDCLFR
ncbi:hypothetical protein [Shewanella donghaensis]|uniref:hypothetical protein n=1 Tax=Shewanella donghaensis TaxID=238836 RepID=UPI001182851D|nr:hypothetical protein [Shewanella donghaensis]